MKKVLLTSLMSLYIFCPHPLYAQASNSATAEVGAEVKEVLSTAKQIKKADKTEKFLVISAFLAALFKLLLSLMKLVNPYFKKKDVPKVVASGLGVLVLLFSKLALGVSWVDAIILAASGPGAVFLHELSKMIPALRALKDEQKAKEGSGEGA